MKAITGFLHKDTAIQERNNIQDHIKKQTSFGKPYKYARVVKGKTIKSWLGDLQTYNVQLIKK